MKNNNKIRVGITHGDINGIGYEVILKALADEHIRELCTPVIYGNSRVATNWRKMLQLPHIDFKSVNNASAATDGDINIVSVVPDDTLIEPGKQTEAAGKAAYAALDRAVRDLKNGDIDVLVTAPINKNNIQSEAFTFSGHTEYLQASLAAEEEDKALMILFNDVVRVALVTTHLPIAKISESLHREDIAQKIKTFNSSLIRDFGIHKPRIAVLALNPHAGDGGLLGTEEIEVISPAIADAQAEKIMAFGPYAADGFFGSGAFRRFDGILAMYHDQGLAPFKTLASESGVNFTAGLPFVRTSPDHGTAYDIAGRGEADGTSMRRAIYAAIDIFRRRESHRAITANPLRKQYVERNKSDNVVLDLSKDE